MQLEVILNVAELHGELQPELHGGGWETVGRKRSNSNMSLQYQYTPGKCFCNSFSKQKIIKGILFDKEIFFCISFELKLKCFSLPVHTW